MSSEIFAGLRNAMDRGASLEQAMQSFINAGYNQEDVRAAGREFASGMSDIIHPEMSVAPATPGASKEASGDNALPPLPPSPRESAAGQLEKSRKRKRVLLLIGILVVLIIFVGALSYLVYTLV